MTGMRMNDEDGGAALLPRFLDPLRFIDLKRQRTAGSCEIITIMPDPEGRFG